MLLTTLGKKLLMPLAVLLTTTCIHPKLVALLADLKLAIYFFNNPSSPWFDRYVSYLPVAYFVLTPLAAWLSNTAQDESASHTSYNDAPPPGGAWPSPPSTPVRPLPRRSPRKRTRPARFIDEFVKYYHPKVWVDVPKRYTSWFGSPMRKRTRASKMI
jgi:hypothetical protein